MLLLEKYFFFMLPVLYMVNQKPFSKLVWPYDIKWLSIPRDEVGQRRDKRTGRMNGKGDKRERRSGEKERNARMGTKKWEGKRERYSDRERDWSGVL